MLYLHKYISYIDDQSSIVEIYCNANTKEYYNNTCDINGYKHMFMKFHPTVLLKC